MLFLRVVLLAALMAGCTMLVGWFAVPVLAAVFAVVVRKASAPGEAALAALLGWGALLARVAMVPAFTTMLPQIGALFGAPGAVVAVLSIALGVLLAWSAARVVAGLVVRDARTAGSVA